MSIDARAKAYGKIWGGWTIGKLIGTGSGGKTAVFQLTRDNLTFTEQCAMKVVNIIDEQVSFDDISDEYREYYEKRKNEMKKIAEAEVNLMHQLKDCYNVVQYSDFEFNEWKDDASFGTDLLIRMDLLGNLETEMKTKEMTQAEIVQVGIDICTALEGCAAHNIIHRDIKPGNIFTNGRQYLLGDYGISKIIENGMGAQTNRGTENYAAPEQFANATNSSYYDNRVDIYSLALTLYVLANKGKLPFTDEIMNHQLAVQMRLSGRPFKKIEGINPELMDVILVGCSYKPEDRFKTATAFKNALLYVKEEMEKSGNAGVNTASPVLGVQTRGYETEPALGMPAQGYETEPALGVQTQGYETEPALGMQTQGYETEPALGMQTQGYETEPALGMPTQGYETEPALGMSMVEIETEESYETEPALEMPQQAVIPPQPQVQVHAQPQPQQNVQAQPQVQPQPQQNVQAQPQQGMPEESHLQLSYIEIEDLKSMAKTKVMADDRDGACAIFMQLAAAGERNAMYTEISRIYNSNKEVKKNPDAAIFWYKKCIEDIKDSWTVSLAENRLGEIYSNGIGIKKDHELAEKYYRSSASKGNPYAKKKFVAGKYVK